MTGDTDRERCLVIGAGPAGLAVAGALRRAGVDALVLERAACAVPKWRASYDRLHINTSAWFSHPPARRFPRRAGLFPSRDDLVALYDSYIDELSLRVRYGVTARRIDRADAAWLVTTDAGSLHASTVVVATGKQKTPVVPGWPGADSFTGTLIHAAEYRNAAEHASERTVVVGAGNSGMDVALDQVESGAAVWMSVRRAPHVMRRQLGGLPHDLFGVLGRRAPRALVDANGRLLSRLAVGDLTDVGLARPEDGPVSRLEEEGRVPTVDAGGFARALRERKIKIVADVSRFAGGRLHLADGSVLTPQLVVAATGYRADLEELVAHLGVLDDRGLPSRPAGREHPAALGLHFVGFTDPRSGLLREIRLEAGRVARAVVGGGEGAERVR